MIKVWILTGYRQSSVNVGKYVITHTDNVSVPGWNGAGYAIIDPTTGENGGFMLVVIGSALLWTSLALFVYIPSIQAKVLSVMLIAASTHIMLAGSFLIAGQKQACFLYMTRAIGILKKMLQHLLKIKGKAVSLMFNIVFAQLQLTKPWDLCLCGEQPYCLDPFVP